MAINSIESGVSPRIIATKESSPNGGPTRVSVSGNQPTMAFIEALATGQLYLVQEPVVKSPEADLTIDSYPMQLRAASGQLTYLELPEQNPWDHYWDHLKKCSP